MDVTDFVSPQGVQTQPEGQKLSPTSSPSKKGALDDPSYPLHPPTQGVHHQMMGEDPFKDMDNKYSDLTTLPPSSTEETGGRMSVSPNDFESSPNKAQAIKPSDDDDPFGLNLSGQRENLPKPAEIPFGKVNGKTEGDGGDAKLLEDLLDQANNIGGDISPDSLLTEDLLSLDKSPAKSAIQKDQVVPPVSQEEDVLNVEKLPVTASPNLMETEGVTNLLSESPMDMDFEEPKLPEGPCFKPPSPVTTSVRAESPKLPDTPCFKPPSPDNKSAPLLPEPEIMESSEPEVMICPAKPSPALEEHPGKQEPDIISTLQSEANEYTRRETKTFDNDSDFDDGKSSPNEFGGGDLPPSPGIMDDDIPPPIPKHSWEMEDQPPPVPPHSITSDFASVGFHSSQASSDFPIHASYDDRIDDEFDEDSLSKPLSHKLSDSLEVLKESPQKDHPLDESLMDLDDLPSSSKNSVKSISPNDSKNILGDYSAADADISAAVTSLPSEMTESGLFSQQPPKDLDSDSLDIDDKVDFKQISEMEYAPTTASITTSATTTTNKPIASITPFSTKVESMLGDAPLPSTMTSSMIMNTSLDEMQAPKFYESEDSSSKTDAPGDEMEKADRNLELQEFEEAIPESIEESGTPASDSGSSKIEVLEVKPTTVKAEPDEPVTKKVEIVEELSRGEAQSTPKPKQNIESDTEAFELSEEMQLLLNTFKPRTWFDPTKLHPTVSELVYWRDPKKSGAVFGSILIVLLALTLMSLISVVAYTSLAVLSGTFAFRVYKSVLQAVQKTQDGHPFKEYLDMDISIPSEKAQELSNAIINYANTAVLQLRRLFLVEDLVDSAKFGLVLYLLTYIGGWFNGLTLLILGYIALFSLPKVYETNKAVIDQYLELINSKISEVTAKVTTAVPFLKKDKTQ